MDKLEKTLNNMILSNLNFQKARIENTDKIIYLNSIKFKRNKDDRKKLLKDIGFKVNNIRYKHYDFQLIPANEYTKEKIEEYTSATIIIPKEIAEKELIL